MNEITPQARAFPNAAGDVFQITPKLLEQGHQAARRSERKRIVLPIHRTQDARVQRMVNFMQPGSYIRPHHHPEAHAIEAIVVLSGMLDFIVFAPDGRIRKVHRLTAGTPSSMIDIEPGIWHGMLVQKDDTALLEFKRGPYSATDDKSFAPWAPEEGAPEAADYMDRLQAECGRFL